MRMKLKKPVFTFAVCLLIAVALKIFMSCTKPTMDDGGYTPGDGISDSNPVHRIDPELKPYLDHFVAIAELKGIDLSYIYDKKITIIYTSNDTKQRVATSYSRDDDDAITITVYKPRFMNRTEQGRKYVMWHEFGHDILNLPHGEVGMMRPSAYSGFFRFKISSERQDEYLYKSLNEMFDIYLNIKYN